MDEGSESEQFISGNKLYQQRARKALPILVRQARANEKIFYSDLANELGMPNPRNLNYVLGLIGQTIARMSERADEIPPIQCLVVNKQTGMPGEGVGWFVSDKRAWSKLSRREQRMVLDRELAKVFLYPDWLDVLDHLRLLPVASDPKNLIDTASKFRKGGESEKHKKLKNYIARNPTVLGLPSSSNGKIEYTLPSGDSLDVLFKYRDDWIAAEVKSSISNEADIVRGIFQCVKYQRTIEAVQMVLGIPQNSRAILILEGELPEDLLPIKNTLGVEVIESVMLK